MCILWSYPNATETFEKLHRKGDGFFQKKLIRLAADDTIEQQDGLGNLLRAVRQWQQYEDLRLVRKYRIGDHRVFVTGFHTDCAYKVVFILSDKKKETDQPGTQKFRNMILKSLAKDSPLHFLELPCEVSENEDSPDAT